MIVPFRACDCRGCLPLDKIFGIRHFRWLVNLFTGHKVTDPTSGFFTINRRRIGFCSAHYPSDYPEADACSRMHRLKAHAVEAAVRVYARPEGKSSITIFQALYYMVKVTLSFLINCIRRYSRKIGKKPKTRREMHPSFLEYLADPHTGEPLRLVAREMRGGLVVEGELVSPSFRFPIVRGIPRFAGFADQGNYAKSFGWQWNRWGRVQFESENVGKPMEGHTARMWEQITAIDTKDLKGALIADFGCGSGRFIEIVRMKNAKVIGLDLSDAVETAKRNFLDDDNVLICQADILRPPIRPGACDGAFSIGVLHHTPDPVTGFEKMVDSVRPDGWVSASVYGKGGYYSQPNVNFYRSLFKRLWPFFGHYPPLIYTYFTCCVVAPAARFLPLGGALHLFFPGIILPDKRWSLLDTFDSVTPSHQSSHESYEVFQWFKKAGLMNIEPSDWGFTSYHGIKPHR